jgi:hypothetical protein
MEGLEWISFSRPVTADNIKNTIAWLIFPPTESMESGGDYGGETEKVTLLYGKDHITSFIIGIIPVVDNGRKN